MADTAPQRNVITRVSCPSTQDIVRDEALAGAPAGTIAVTDHQSAGRGRRGPNVDYLENTVAHLEEMGVAEPELVELRDLVRKLAA